MITNQTFLGLDVGEKRTGVARAGTIARLPEPLATLSTETAIDELQSLIKEHQATAIVAGIPRDMQGHDTEQTAWVRAWLDDLKKSIEVPLYWQDEALTTVAASSGSGRMDSKPGDIDARAACVILDDFLRLPEDRREEYRL